MPEPVVAVSGDFRAFDTQVRETGTFVSFSSAPWLVTGDVLSLGEQAACSTASLANGACTVEDEEELRGAQWRNATRTATVAPCE